MHSILAVLLLLVMGQAIASDSTRENIEEILNGLTLPDYTPQAFVERRQNKLLAEPLIFRGEVLLSPDGTFLKTINTPFHERVLITNDFVELERNGKTKRLSLQRARGVYGLYTGLRAFLERDIETLLSLFKIAAVEQGVSWHVELVPVDPKLKRHVSRMMIDGKGPDIVSIRTMQTEDNWQEMLFSQEALP
jgi:hypothetical protein